MNYISKDSIACTVCGDLKIKVIDVLVDKIDYYKGSPKFPDKKVDNWYW